MSLVLLALGVACLVYGVSIFLVFSGTLFFAVWFVLGAVLIAWSRLVACGAWEALPSPVRGGACAIVALGVAVLASLGTAIMRDARQDPPADLDYLVVLGAQVKQDGPSVVLRYRLDAAYDYLVENPDTLCVVSGGQGPNEPFPEADGMADYLIARGIDEGRILREPASETTVQNIAFSRELMGDDDASVGIVTNDFHVFRATRIARAQGLANAVGVPGGSVAWYLPNNVLRECLGVIKDVLAGNMSL
ncbi:MAG: YdcF family protein [Olsenella sp.]|nr:YdcF family protein [Olsenella sp.]